MLGVSTSKKTAKKCQSPWMSRYLAIHKGRYGKQKKKNSKTDFLKSIFYISNLLEARTTQLTKT